MTSLTVVILVGREERHIRRCLEKLVSLQPRQVVIVESQTGDRTHEEAMEFAAAHPEMGVEAVFHTWPGNQARQFNWAVDHLSIQGEWVLRLDADEYLYDEAIAELKALVKPGGVSSDVASLSMLLERHAFGGFIRHAKPIEIVRVFRTGHGHYAQMEMDEHLVIEGGRNQLMSGRFVDHSLMSFHEWQEKHREYAKREAQMMVEGRCNQNKRLYYKLPPYFRAFAYFCVRYFLQMGFLDGVAGWRWNFWQGLWYRCLCDFEIGKLKRRI